ncbi:DUF2779 domain-containing protein [Maribellus mangrovi]|uniref:DUF2779 domain-containing protein n=1 Tax=Maribellus mangrovi TaxID=3133146 RepID=UPI0030ECAA3F
MNQIKRQPISKSSFIRGLQCYKSLYLKKHHPELEDQISESQQAIFDKGTNVGILAQQLFPGGVDLGEFIPSDFGRVLSETSKLIGDGQDVIYEAGFSVNGTICFVDILVKEEGKWYAYEVKGSTSISDVYIWDTAFQYHVLTSVGLELEDIFVIHLNNQYVRKDELDVHELFTIQSVLNEVQLIQGDVIKNINLLKQMLGNDIAPDIDIGKQCKDPYSCSFIGHCWSGIPEYSVFDISRLSADKKFNLYRQGILEVKDVPSDYPLSDNQQLQVYAEKSGERTIDSKRIQKFIKEFTFPLYFLDFETFQPAIPLFNESRPYQQIPFQYSLHILKENNGDLIHKEFLAETNGDPRITFIEQLITDIEDTGDVVVYNKSFEITRLKEIARDFPHYKDSIDRINSRIVDLMEPFSKKWYYTPDMKGSYSIKLVLPALVLGFSYENLEINKGDMASLAFEYLYTETNESVIAKTRTDLLEYCKLDTLAMVEILKVLQKV